MATCKPVSPLIKNALSVILIALTTLCAASARILDEELPIPTPSAGLTGSVAAPVANAAPAAASVAAPVANAAPAAASVATPFANAAPAAASVAAPFANAAPAAAVPAAATTSAAAVNVDSHNTLTFFMHDILGGSNPSARAVTGVVNNPAVNGQVPFAKANGAVLPVNNGVPSSNNNGNINNNNLPFLTGLGGNTANVIVNNGNNINAGFGIPVQNGGQLPDPATIQKLMFGTLTVIDDELTEGHELGSGLVGRAQGFYVASSIDGLSQTLAFTAMFEIGGYVDSITFFGVHRTAVSESQLAIMGGTGKYVNAQGFATVKTLPGTNLHNTDGLETLLELTVYLAY